MRFHDAQNAPTRPLTVAIVGGGITGLTAAYALQTSGLPVRLVLIERAARLGGKVLTERAGGLVIEGGPDSFLASKPWAAELARELGLAEQLTPINTLPRPTAILARGRPVPLPEGMLLAAPTDLRAFLRSPALSLAGRLRALLDLVLPARAAVGDESLTSLIRRRLGAEVAERLAEPLMAGIYSADPERQSLAATFPNFPAMERAHGSLIRGARLARAARLPGPAFLTLRDGVGTLVDALAAKLNADVRLGRVVTSLTHGAGYQLTLDDGARIAADAVILALPPQAAAALSTGLPELAAALTPFRSVSTGTVTLAYSAAAVRLPLDGFGLVIPAGERRQINAVTVTTRKFAGRAPADTLLLRAFVGGHRGPQTLELDDTALTELVRAELRATLGVTAAPQLTRVFRWGQGSPQYDLGHAERLQAAERACPPGLELAGGAYRGIGLPDCIRDARRAAAQTVAFLQARSLPFETEAETLVVAG